MKISAKEMHLSPAKAYRSADLGEKVVINHDRYPDKIFELVARHRNPLMDKAISDSIRDGFGHVMVTESGEIIDPSCEKSSNDQ